MLFFLATAISVNAYSLGTLTDLSNLDVGNWVGTSSVNLQNGMCYDGVDLIYISWSGSKLGAYNITSNTLTDLSYINATGGVIACDNVNKKVYLLSSSEVSGITTFNFGVYNVSDGLWYNLSGTVVGGWVIGTSRGILYDPDNNLVYTSFASGSSGSRLGYYNASDGLWYLAIIFPHTSNVQSLIKDPYDTDRIYTSCSNADNCTGIYNLSENNWTVLSAYTGRSDSLGIIDDYLYIGAGNFSKYNILNNTYTDLSGTDPNNWFGAQSFMAMGVDDGNKRVYTGQRSGSGKFGVYEVNDNIWYDLSSTDPNNWLGVLNINSIITVNNLMYIGTGTGGGFGVYNPNVCWENWVVNNTACINDSYTRNYYDNHNCGTYNDLPIDNGSVLSCALVGNGSIDNPYNISVINNLEYFGKVNGCGYWQLVNDLDLSAWSMTEGITTASSLPVFNISNCSTVYFDGNGYKMYGLNDILFGNFNVLNVSTTFNRVWLEFDITSGLNTLGSFAYRIAGVSSNFVVFNNSYFNGRLVGTHLSQSGAGGVIGTPSFITFDNLTTNITMISRYASGIGDVGSNVKVLNSHITNNLTSSFQQSGGLFFSASSGNNFIINTVINTTQYNMGGTASGGITGSSFTGNITNVTIYMESYNSSSTIGGIIGGIFTGVINNAYVDLYFFTNKTTTSAMAVGLTGSASSTTGGTYINITSIQRGTIFSNGTCSYGGVILTPNSNGNITVIDAKIFPDVNFMCKSIGDQLYSGILRTTQAGGTYQIINSAVIGNITTRVHPETTTGVTRVGGIIGTTATTTGTLYVNNTYFIGNLTGNYTGGLMGSSGAGTVVFANSFAVSYLNYVTSPIIGLAGNGSRIFINSYYDRDVALFDDGLYNRSTTEMKTQSNYDGWDFNNTWQMCGFVNDGYPSLRGLDDSCCIESWTPAYSNVCNGITPNRTKYYTDTSMCGTTNNLPGDNGTVEACCVESWTPNYTPPTCNGIIPNRTKYYIDTNTCGTIAALPGDNGTVSACCVESWTPSYTPSTCPSNSLWTITYTDTNTCGTTAALPGNNGTSISCVYISPVYDNQTFNGKTTTDLNTVNTSAVENLTIASSTSAVQWTTTLDISNITTPIAEVVTTTSSFISVNVAAAPELDSPAEVSLSVPTTLLGACADFTLYYATGYYTTQSDIVANGVIVATGNNVGGDCMDPSICTNVECSGGVLTFTAQHFDGFGIGDVEASTIESCQDTRRTIYAGFAIIAILIVAGAAALLIMMLKSGNLDGTLLIAATVGFIAVGVVLMIGYFIISKMPGIICG